MIGGIEWLGDCVEAAVADLDLDVRIGEQVVGPLRAVAGRDDDRSVRFVYVADGDRSRQTAPAPPRRQPGDLPLEEEIRPDAVRRQRARCQDLPSVWVDGA